MSRNKRQAREEKRREQEARARIEARNRWIRNISLGAVAVALGVLFVLSVAGGDGGEPDTGTTTADGWDLPALDGEDRVALADFAGKPTVAVFFASWCEFCDAEVPGFATLSDQLGAQVNWVGINSQDDGRGGANAARWGITERWPLARDIGGHNGSDLSTATFATRGMPLTVIYNQAGTVVHIQRGAMSAANLQQLLVQSFDITT